MSKKKGVKKGSQQAAGFLDGQMVKQELRDQHMRTFGRLFQADMFTIALGRMGWREKKFKELDAVLADVYKEYCTDIINDSKDDKDIWYSKDTLDREIKQYVGSLFVPYDERYDF